MAACRTAALGGHVEVCDACGYRQPAYNSCRNRHCPQGQAAARAAWLEDRRADLLPVGYFPVVFTLPALLAPLARQNQAKLYDLLFACAAETLQEIAADPKYLGARLGFVAVLHTWGQNLQYHPPIHCVVPGGGLSPDQSRWSACRPGFFLPVRVLSRVFRGKYLQGLQNLYAQGQLSLEGALVDLQVPQNWVQLRSQAYQTDWVVYAKLPFGGPEQVLKYLARYSHRVAIANDRLVSLEEGHVTFRWKNYAQGWRWPTRTLLAVEFIRRFLLHVLPQGFVRIRHYGFLCNRLRPTLVPLCRKLLGQALLTAPLCMPIKKCSAVPTQKCSAQVQGNRHLGTPTMGPSPLRLLTSSILSLHLHLLSRPPLPLLFAF